MTAEEREAWLDQLAEADEPPEEDDAGDWENPAPLTAEELAEARDGAAAGPTVWAGLAGRRGPSQPGSARVYPGESASRAAAFGSGLALDVMPACPGRALSADAAAGDDDTYVGVSDDELLGVLSAWDRLEAHMAARKLAAAAELIRRFPVEGSQPEQMPESWDESFAGSTSGMRRSSPRTRRPAQVRPPSRRAVRLTSECGLSPRCQGERHTSCPGSWNAEWA